MLKLIIVVAFVFGVAWASRPGDRGDAGTIIRFMTLEEQSIAPRHMSSRGLSGGGQLGVAGGFGVSGGGGYLGQ